MHKRQILKNALFSLIQVVFVSAVLVVQYRFLLRVIGIRDLGIWALVLAATAATQIANLGLSAGVVKFVAKYAAKGDIEKVSRLIQTAVLSLGFFVAVVMAIAYFVLRIVLKMVVGPESFPAAVALLPFTLVAFWIIVVTGIYQAGLDGLQRMDIRNQLLMAAAVIHLILCFILAPRFGLIGLGYARIVQNIVVLIFSFSLLRRRVVALPLIPIHWDRKLFKEMLGYGANFQVITLLNMLCDPVTKALLSRFGSLDMVGYYEMASRMIMQFRSLVVSANQAIVPAIAHMLEKTPERLKSIYRTSYDLMFYLSWPLFTALAVSAPIISRLWIGHYEKMFVMFAAMLAAGWLFNSLAGPAYFSYMGIGNLRWNVIAHITMAVVNLIFGILLGKILDGTGIVAAWAVALSAAGLIIIWSHSKSQPKAATPVWPRDSRLLSAVCLGCGAGSIVLQILMPGKMNSLRFHAMTLGPMCILVLGMALIHPMRRRLWGWIRYDLMKVGIQAAS